MKCTDCGASTISPSWQRCYDCAYRRCQKIMAGESPEPTKVVKRAVFIRGDRVLVKDQGQGTVRHRKAGKKIEYAVDLDSGSRVHVPAIELAIIDERPTQEPDQEVGSDHHPSVGIGDDGALPVLPDGPGEADRSARVRA